MIQRADYVVPHFNNQLRLDKPPLAYWAQVASYRIFGETDFGARFPSAIAAALTSICDRSDGAAASVESSWLVGGDHFHAVATDFRSCKSRSRRYVARVVHDAGELGRV